MKTIFVPMDMVRAGWATFKTRPWFFIGAYLLAALAFMIASQFVELIAPTAADGTPVYDAFSLRNVVGTLLAIVFNMLYSMGITAFSIKSVDTPDVVTFSDLWHPRPFWKFTGVTLLSSILVILGLVLLIVPGIIAALMFLAATYLVLDKHVGVIEALKESKRITSGYKWKLLVLAFLILGVNILGLLALVVGLLVSLPVTTLVMAHTYRFLEKNAPVVTA